MRTEAGSIEVCDSCPVSTVKQAIDLSQPGDTILIRAGLYQEGNIVVDKRLVIRGEANAVLDGEVENEILTILADSVVITGLQFQNIGTSYLRENAAINLVECTSCVVEGNRMINTFFAVYLQKAKKCVVRNNFIQGEAVKEMSSGNAIHAWNCDSLTIENNVVRNHRDGIYLEFVDNSVIAGNTSINNLRYGLHFMFSDNDQYINNTFETNGAGVAVMFSKHMTMRNNRFQKNWGSANYGLLLKEITDSKIDGNTFTENTSAIYAESANRISMVNNDFTNNGWALKILGSCVDNEFRFNNFSGNTFDLTTNGKSESNTYVNNYWSDYSGYDLDRDGFGDVPHRPIRLFSHVVSTIPESIVLLRSLFVDVINFAESVTPAFSPESLVDPAPYMRRIKR